MSTSLSIFLCPVAWQWRLRLLFSGVRGSDGPMVLGKPPSPSLSLANRLLGSGSGPRLLLARLLQSFMANGQMTDGQLCCFSAGWKV